MLYDRLSPLAFGLALRVAGERHLAEDAVQEAFLRVWRRADRYDPARGAPRPWLLRLVRNVTIDQMRSRGGTRPAEASSGPDPSHEGAAPRPQELVGRGRPPARLRGRRRPATRAAAGDRDRLFRRTLPQRDRGARGHAARDREDPHPRRSAPPAGAVLRRGAPCVTIRPSGSTSRRSTIWRSRPWRKP